MKNRSSQPNGVENGLNMSQSVPNIKINHRKHILELYKWHKDHLQKITPPPLLKKFPYAHFHTKSSQICQWKIDFHNPTMSKMVQTSPNRSQTSKLIIRNIFWTSKSHIRITLKKDPQPPSPKKIPTRNNEDFFNNMIM